MLKQQAYDDDDNRDLIHLKNTQTSKRLLSSDKVIMTPLTMTNFSDSVRNTLHTQQTCAWSILSLHMACIPGVFATTMMRIEPSSDKTGIQSTMTLLNLESYQYDCTVRAGGICLSRNPLRWTLMA